MFQLLRFGWKCNAVWPHFEDLEYVLYAPQSDESVIENGENFEGNENRKQSVCKGRCHRTIKNKRSSKFLAWRPRNKLQKSK